MYKLDEEQKEVSKGIIEYLEFSNYSDIKKVINEVKKADLNDDYIYINNLWSNCGEREILIVNNYNIDDLFAERVEDTIRDCFLPKDLPGIIEYNINWDGIIEDVKRDQGYGGEFSSWDGSEYETENFYYFKN